jgi:uncharacterized protein (TIGR02996 family)
MPPRKPFDADGPTCDPQEAAFLRSIRENPDDDTARLVYADWLEEWDEKDRSAFLRLEVEMSRSPRSHERFAAIRAELNRLDEVIWSEWVGQLIRPGRLLNCVRGDNGYPTMRFAYRCQNRWVDLDPTQEEQVRYCGECKKTVHYCDNKEEVEKMAVEGNCIAINSRLALAVVAEHPTPDLFGSLPDSYELWAGEFFARHRKPSGKPWWQFWR